MDSKLCTPYVAVSEFYIRTAKMLGICPVSDYYLELCDLSVRGRIFPILPAHYCLCLWRCRSYIINLLQSGNMEKYSVLDLGILPPFGRADMVDLERNISLYMIALQVIY